MHPLRKAVGLFVVVGVAALFPAHALAAGGPPASWPTWHLQAAFVALLAPLALILIAVGATPPEEAGETMAAALAALVVGVVAYVACGFAFQYGGIALQVGWPGLEGLAAEWTPVDPSLGMGWGAAGLQGFFLMGEAVTPDVYALAAIQLPAVAVAVLIPTLAMARRVPRGLLIIVAALVGGVLYPLAGNWVWGGGWLALLGVNAGLGHGFVDLGGSATIHFLGASAALAGILIFGRKSQAERYGEQPELPPAHFSPLVMLICALMAPVGWLGLLISNPLLPPDISTGLLALSLILAGMGGAAPTLFYSWLATGRVDALLAARGMVAGLVAGSASCGFVTPWSAMLAGFVAGTALPLLLFVIEHGLHWHDPNAILATHGLPGLLGALWLALFANGHWGLGWNGVNTRYGLAEQGVAGLFVEPGFVSDIPGQFYAQLAGLGSILILAFVVPLLIFGLLNTLHWLFRPKAPARRAPAR